MKKYNYSTADEDSSYESDGETIYRPGTLGKRYIGGGTYSNARRFESVSDNLTHKIKTRIVLEPATDSDDTPTNYKESRRKYGFFSTLHPQIPSFYHEDLVKNTYRLVVPEIPGKPYNQLRIKPGEQQIKLFISTIRSLKNCHANNIVCMDLTESNIYYVAPTSEQDIGHSYLIDGGSSNQIGTNLNPAIFQVAAKDLTSRTMVYTQIAPECWYTRGSPPSIATTCKDVYALGSMLNRILHPLVQELKLLLSACTMQNSTERPTLDDLESALMHILCRYQRLPSEAPTNQVFFAGLNTPKQCRDDDIEERKIEKAPNT